MRKSLLVAGVVGIVSVVAVGAAFAASSGSSKIVRAPRFTAATADDAIGADWATAGGNNLNTRYSSLNEISTKNVSGLTKVFALSLDGPEAAGAQKEVEQGPVEYQGTMYVGTGKGELVAIDAATGAQKWRYQGPGSPPGAGFSIGAVRGQSIGDGMVFFGQQDGTIAALDQTTGKKVWVDTVTDLGISAPVGIYYNGLVYVGETGGDILQRGHIDALDAKTGALVWRFWTTPDASSPAALKSWGGGVDEAATGGGALWTYGAFDPKTNTGYFATGNPDPYSGRGKGNDLWTDSVVALNASTGKMKRAYQTLHHDEWDYDCSTPVMLFDTTIAGKAVPGVEAGCKSAYTFELNRTTGKPIFAIPETKVPDTSAGKGAALNSTSVTQPIPTGGAANIVPHCPTAAQAGPNLPGYPTAPDGTPYKLSCMFAAPFTDAYTTWSPNYGSGGMDWDPMSYSPVTSDVYICAKMSYLGTKVVPGTTGKDIKFQNAPTGYGSAQVGLAGTFTALNMKTNKIDWQQKWQAWGNKSCYSGSASTAGGLTFVGSSSGNFIAYDSKTGKKLWSDQTPYPITAPPIVYSVNGKEYVEVYVGGPLALLGGVANKQDLVTVYALPS
jgi:quinohemoprotein ethanol dehydrogenase